MDRDFFRCLAREYCDSCLHLDILASERLVDRLEGRPTHMVPLAGGEGEMEVLDLGACRLKDEDAQVLSVLLMKVAVVKGVDVSQNDIGDAGAVALASLLPPGGSLAHLDLSRNNVGEIGGLALLTALSRERESKGDRPVVGHTLSHTHMLTYN